MRTLRPLSLLAALLLAPTALRAQIDPGATTGTDKAQAAYLALTLTPIGALTPMTTAREAGLATRSPGFRVQFANRDEGDGFSRRSLAAGVDLAFGANTLGLTAGYVDLACDVPSDVRDAGIDVQCKGAMMGGAELAMPLLRHPLGANDPSAFTIGALLSAGVGTGNLLAIRDDSGFIGGDITEKATAYAVAIQAPMALVLRSEGISVVPNIRPGIAYGHASAKMTFQGATESASDGDARFMLAGGLGLLFRNSGIGLNVGFHKTFVKDGDTLLGVGLSFTGR